MKNEIGNKYGKLLVIERAPKPEGRPKGAYWLCKCDCGNCKVIRGADLRSGNVNSCGCLYGQHSVKNEVGHKYGRLTVLERAESQGTRGAIWKCKCDCGNIILATGGDLRNGSVQSCGCLIRDKSREANLKDLTGQHFGKLVVKSFNEEESTKNKATFWNCDCDCGNKIIVRGSNLKTGATKSCGCIKTSFAEEVIEKLLKDNNIKYQKEYTFKNFYTPKKGVPRFDFAIFDDNDKLLKLIEYDGEQHYKNVQPWNGEEGLKYRQELDKLKTKYCKEHNIKLLRIPYTYNLKELTIDKILENTEDFDRKEQK